MKTLIPALLLVLGGLALTSRATVAQLPPATPPGSAFTNLTANITDTTLSDALWDIAKGYVENPAKLKNPKIPWFELAEATYDSAWDILIEGLVEEEICSAAKKWTGTTKVFVTVTYTVINGDESNGPATTVVSYGLGVKGGSIVAYPLTEVPIEKFNKKTGKWEETGEYEWIYDDEGGLEKKEWGSHKDSTLGDSDPWGVYDSGH